MTWSHRRSGTSNSQQPNILGNCVQFKERIETASKSVSGVTLADQGPETKMLQVEFDGTKTNLDAIQKAIAKVGHDTEKYKASDAVYKELPEYCLYKTQEVCPKVKRMNSEMDKFLNMLYKR